ncbi:Cof-type HAD-IIB family hydrolase [Bacillus carboniphilus]|uniref:Cof-type HAD-IIB family hydrolase n=1 Tax=Bacillus carboniphilus TaxID=86663 RepID=A0ABY9JWM3_9BACI|nr:Cof-type HAD-IIB family hydrolase [Bacillus carboniphilus]WLR42825.1 Cof-type HAD-IIB family hydrolase [Bacillus carboniphilus]
MLYRLLALNIDGTLLKNNGRLQSSTKEAIYYVQQKDVILTLVTNRHFQSAKKIAKALKIEAPIITHSGAFIAKNMDAPHFVKKIPEETTFNLVQILETFECNIRIIHERYSIGNRKKIGSQLISRMLLNSGDPLFYPVQFVESLSDVLMDEPVEAPSIQLLFESEKEISEVVQTIRDAFPQLELAPMGGNKLSVTSNGVSKLSGLQWVCNYYDIPTEQSVVIANDIDDIEMLEHVGLGVAVGNASYEVKKAADWITRSNDELGVDYMVKEHFRKQHRPKFLQKIKRG